MGKMTHEQMMEKAWRLIHELGIAEKGEEAGANYVVENIYQIRDAFYADLESGNDFDGEDMEGFISRHGIRLAPVKAGAGKLGEFKMEITREDAQKLGRITTRDEAGTHFMQIYDRDWLDTIEAAGYINISKPVHQTGIEYSEEYWSVEVTEEGIEAGEKMNWGE